MDIRLNKGQEIEDTKAEAVDRKPWAYKVSGIYPFLRNEPSEDDFQSPSEKASYSKKKSEYQEYIHMLPFDIE